MMDFDPDDLPLGTVIETSQGRICIHHVADDLLAAYDKFGRDASSSVRLRALLPKIASQVPSEQPAPADPAVTDRMAELMNENDLERIARCCLQEVLGESILKKSQKLQRLPARKNNESSVSYLDRVVEAGRKHRQSAREAEEKRFRDEFGLAPGGTFGGVVREAQESQSLVDQAGNEVVIHRIDPFRVQDAAPSQAHLAIDPIRAVLEEQPSAEQPEPVRDQGELPMELLATSAQAQAQFLEDFRKASERSNKRAARVMWISVLSLLVTVAVSSIGLWYLLRSFERFEQNRRASSVSSDDLEKKILDALGARESQGSARLQALESESAALRARLESIENATNKRASVAVPATPQRKLQRSGPTKKRQRR